MRSLLAPLLLFALARCASAPVAVSQAPIPREPEEVFHETLSPYGEWIVVSPYGRVWSPAPAVVGADFRPYYTRGHWVNTVYGWSFESDWSWAWVPFHYGHWYLDPGFGWLWVPSRSWAPAWVMWRYGGRQIGWAPLPPAGITIAADAVNQTWCFVETRHFTAPDLDHYLLPVEQYSDAFRATVPTAETMTASEGHWPPGPTAQQISQELGQPIHSLNVRLSKSAEVSPHQLQPSPNSGSASNAPMSAQRPEGSGTSAAPPLPATASAATAAPAAQRDSEPAPKVPIP